MFVDVAIPVPIPKLFTYRWEGEPAIAPGVRVAVPFGGRVLTGVAVRSVDTPALDAGAIKAVIKVLDEEPALSADLLDLGKWIAEYYACPLGEALAAMLPAFYRPLGKMRWRLGRTPTAEEQTHPAAEVLLARLGPKPKDRKTLLDGLPKSAAKLFKHWSEVGVVVGEPVLPRRRARTEAAPTGQQVSTLTLSAAQAEALDRIVGGLQEPAYAGFLLHGVTGSGKTEVYLRAMAAALEQGRGAILLVPEISLTPQMRERVQQRFGDLAVVMHSGLAPGDRAVAWQRLRTGAAKIAVGARSAVFAPVPNLGLLVVDEEAENSYKQEDAPRYHARDAAAVRARAARAVLVLGSATPSVESFYNARQGRLRLLTLPERIDGKRLPAVELVDLAEAARLDGRMPLITEALHAEMAAALHRKEQVILYLNRRGYAPAVLCPACRQALRCPDCSLALVYHQDDDRLHCHACGQVYPPGRPCPDCGAACLRLVGFGTQRVEEETRRLFPDARVIRMDSDSTRRRGSLEKLWDQFRKNAADILIGTQMAGKGMDFPGVTLVGVLAADLALHFPDFRAEERVFSRLVQVAGRAGRGDRPGRVLIQTLDPRHPVMQLACQQDYTDFFERELRQRQDLNYPPFSRLAKIVVRSEQPIAAANAAERIARQLRPALTEREQLLGPAAAPRARVAKETRCLLLLKCATVSARRRLLDKALGVQLPASVRTSVDVDPQDLM